MASYKFNNSYIKDYFSVVGPMEKDSQIKYYDLAMDDYYYKEKTFEKAEIKMQKVVIDNILLKNKLLQNNIDLLIGGDLLNQIGVTSYSAKNFHIPVLGLYSACATFTESLIVGSMFLENSNNKNYIAITSSHNLNSEKQFRFPVEYGSPKPHTATFTATGSVGCLVTKEKSKIKIESATVGKVVDWGESDANHLGAVMAPAAIDVLLEHLNSLNRDIDYYDLILTGDLGCVGAEIFKTILKDKFNIKVRKYYDAGCILYLKSQKTYSGGSGPACLPLILFNKILVNNTKYKKILIIGTGALHNPVLVNQKCTIPSIAHAVSLEVNK